MGLCCYVLGIELTSLPNFDLLLTQSKYIRDLSIKAGMDSYKSIASSMITSPILSTYDPIFWKAFFL